MYIPVEDIVLPIVFGVPGIVIVTKMWFSHRERMAGLQSGRQGSAITDARIERIEQAVDSIAIEMERVSEGQRFVTKLLSERAPSAAEQLPPGQNRNAAS
jgi:hypothetical protein